MNTKPMNRIGVKNAPAGLLDILSHSLSVANRSVLQWRQNADSKRQMQNLSAHFRKDAGLDQSVSTQTYDDYLDPASRRL
ncbi:MAG: hypothetical protein DRR06_19270 [Gammaproteobacteria bacterium]|nr:MAG: hypothetical protein DRR06_19270 [Gammaproteobacteria bacterium]